MIIYRDHQPPLLSDFGILVPMLKGRAVRVRQELSVEFGEEIFLKDDTPLLEEADFEAVHTNDFLSRCRHDSEKVIAETFELINPDGSYHRYDPARASRPLSELVELYRQSCGDSYLCVKAAGTSGFAYYLGGGFHHALSDRGRGFCLFNDVVIAARKFQKDVKAGIVWVIDIDAHKGCGTAEITAQDPSILTLSIHMKNGWPLDTESHDEKGALKPWFIPSNVDIAIMKGEEENYLTKLEMGLKELENLSHDLPVLAIVVDGSDPYERDALPSANLLSLTQSQCFQRNLLVYDFLKSRSIPQAYLMSGGYGEENWVIHHQFIQHVMKEVLSVSFDGP